MQWPSFRGFLLWGLSASGGVSAPKGVCVCSWGVCSWGVSAPGGCLLWGVGVSAPGGVGCLLLGVSTPGGCVWYPSMH